MGGEVSINNHKRKVIMFAFLFVYLFTVLWVTILKRSKGFHVAQFGVFWSYKKWLAGDINMGQEIMANIAMFIPFGFLFFALLSSFHFSKKSRVAMVISMAIIISLAIEILQLVLMLGLFEWDDVVSNTGGAVIGVGIYGILEKSMRKKCFNIVVLTIGAIVAAICFVVYIRERGAIGMETDTTSIAYCFQVDNSTYDNGEVNLSGFTFQYERADGGPTLTLRSKGDEVKMITRYGLSRPDVNEYFLCDHDYTNCGYTATGEIESGKEYEIMICWPWSPEISTGVFIIDDDVHYTIEESFSEPNTSFAQDLKDIVENGTLRVFRPDFHCWVYQKDWDLYWIVDPDIYFEEDGSTYIQYQIWTTQTEKLPEKRVTHGNLWDNIGGEFEKYEIRGDFGEYRVMKREIPTEYSVTSIVTGYHNNDEWIWRNYFRPIYSF